ncbi:MAG: hypothetical protein IID37_12475 [Planctomycetes bacterium]|nr:hypothetical protein [Planctomycetota bacterium]
MLRRRGLPDSRGPETTQQMGTEPLKIRSNRTTGQLRANPLADRQGVGETLLPNALGELSP